MHIIFALVTGLIFGTGLIVSGMSNPAKVLNFLDLFGTWDPSLLFVMGGAIAVTLPGFRLAGRRAKPFFAEAFHWPTRTDFDARLVAGAAIFGLGWGLGGFCPGPAVTALPLATTGILAFFPGMLIGMWIAKTLAGRSEKIVAVE